MVSLDGLTALFSATGSAAMVAAAKGTFLLFGAALAAWMLRHRSAAARHAVWTAAVAGQLLLLLLGPALPRVDVAVRVPALNWSGGGGEAASGRAFVDRQSISGSRGDAAASIGSQIHSPTEFGAEGARTAPLSAPASVEAGHSANSPAAAIPAPGLLAAVSPTHLLAGIWLLGLMLILARFAAATAAVARVAGRSAPVEDGAWLSLTQRLSARLGIRRPLILLRGAELDVPVTWGIVYPVVLLPEDSSSWPEERRSFVLLHELAHVRRLDALTQVVAQVVTAIFWFNPLVWYAAKQLRIEREHACDDYVLEHGTRPSAYADGLLDMVRTLGRHGDAAGPAFAALAMARRGELEGRMLAILDPRAPRRASPRLVAATSGALILLALPLAAMRPVDAAEPGGATAEQVAGEGSPTGEASPTVGRSAAGEESPSGTTQAASSADSFLSSDLQRHAAVDTTVERESGMATDSSAAPASRLATPLDTPRTNQWAAEFGTRLRYACGDRQLRDTGEQVLLHENGSGGGVLTEAFAYGNGRCTHSIFTGDIRFDRALTQVVSMSPGARAYFHELSGSGERFYMMRADFRGAITRSYVVDGAPRAAEEGSRWLGEAIRWSVLRMGYGLRNRIDYLIKDGGVDAVLAEVASLNSDASRRIYYTALLGRSPKPGRAEVDRVLRDASSKIRSDSDLRVVTEKAIEAGASPDAVRAALAMIRSDGDRRVVLTKALASGDGSWLIVVLRSVRDINSSSDQSAVLRRAAQMAMSRSDARREFLVSATGLSSSGDMRSVLSAAAKHLPRQSGPVRELLAAAPSISSNGDRSSLLRQIAGDGLLVDDAAREAYVAAARTLTSDGDFRSAMDAMLRTTGQATQR
jgi:beta-lactamase regulating signal transducer with metallopeptidase domain